MQSHKQSLLSRRQFARRAAVLSATASLVPAGMVLPQPSEVAETEQLPENYPKLSPEGQAEAEARCQLVLSRHGARLTDEEKKSVRMLCFSVQPNLEKVRAFSLSNGDVPALFLKPIVERDKSPALKPNATSTMTSPKNP
jgi:hypothetical protein